MIRICASEKVRWVLHGVEGQQNIGSEDGQPDSTLDADHVAGVTLEARWNHQKLASPQAVTL